MTEENDRKLQAIVRGALDLEPNADVTAARQIAVESWDSLAHALLMLAIESEFAVSIDIADQIQLTSYRAIRHYLSERGL